MNTTHAKVLAWLDSLEDEGLLDTEARYPTLEMLTVEEILHRGAGHEHGHAADIARVLEIS